jgi:hypothetical protein
MKITALLLSLALATPAMAFLEPPASYNKPYPGGTAVRWFPKAEMWTMCNKLAMRSLPRHPAECGVVRWVKDGKFLTKYRAGAKKKCFVYINERFNGTPDGDLLFRHGRAHCNGWKHPVQQVHPQ